MKNLLKKFTDEEILLRLFELYPDQEKSLKGYMLTLKELRETRPKKSKMKICVSTVIDDLAEEDEDKEYVHVDGYLRGSKWHYAIEYSPWAEWLGMEVTKKSLKNFTELDIVAYCLWEMTWSGYSDKEVQKNYKDIIETTAKAMKDIKSGKAKTVPWEEVKKKLK